MSTNRQRKRLLEKIKQELDNCSRPLFFFDDDPDGLASFLLLYRYKQAGKGVVVKVHPTLDDTFLNTVKDYDPDKIFILDIPKVSETFLKKLSVPVFYIDHHKIFTYQQDNLTYFNPHLFDEKDERCVTYWCYNIVNVNKTEKEEKLDRWVAMAGCVGDWFLPEFKDEFAEEYPELLSKDIKKPEDALFNSKLGRLVRIFSFLLKGKHKEVMAAIKVLTRINSPLDIIEQKTSQGKFVYRRFEKVNKHYEELINSIKDENIHKNVVEFMYTENQWSFTSDLSNELLYKYPDKVIIVCREKGNEFKCSLRSNKHKLPDKISKSLTGLTGYGGGHDLASAANVPEQDFSRFIDQLKAQII